MEIYYWTGFSKRKNSTKQPTSGTKVDVVLKVEGSIMSPSFELSGVPKNATYFYVSDYGRYYFVDNVDIMHNGLYRFNCTVDTLASFKSAIGGTTAFVERSASAGDPWLFDALVTPTGEIVQDETTEGDTLSSYDINGSIVFKTLGSGGIESYVVSDISNLDGVFQTAFDVNDIDWTDIMTSLKNLFLSISSPAQYVHDIKWFPFDARGTGYGIPTFGWAVGSSGLYKPKRQETMVTALSKPHNYYNDWRDFDPRFTKAHISLPCAGVIPIDPQLLNTNLAVTYYVDIPSGQGMLELTSGSTTFYKSSVGIGVQMMQGGLGGTGSISGLAQIATSASLNPASFVAKAGSGVQNAIEGALQPSHSIIGNAGCIGEWYSNPFCKVGVIRCGSTEHPTARLGAPTRKNLTLSSLSGYVQCSGASVSIDGFDAERDIINGYLNSGFYYE